MMKKRIVQVSLLFLSVAIVALADQGSSPSLRQDGALAQLQASEAFLKFVPVGKPIRLTLVDRRLGRTSVVGVASRTFKNGLALSTSDRLAFLPERGTEVVLSAPSTDAASCLLPEFGIDCFGSFCAGTTYCLPGDGPGGFVRSCE
jgi:hypothetical protein